jgi:hypothetical protein
MANGSPKARVRSEAEAETKQVNSRAPSATERSLNKPKACHGATPVTAHNLSMAITTGANIIKA